MGLFFCQNSAMEAYLHFLETNSHTKTSRYTPNPQSITHHHSFTSIQIILPAVDGDELKLGNDVGELSAITGSYLGSCGLHCCSWQINILSFPVSSYPVLQEALYSDWLKDVWWRATVLAAGLSSAVHDSTIKSNNMLLNAVHDSNKPGDAALHHASPAQMWYMAKPN